MGNHSSTHTPAPPRAVVKSEFDELTAIGNGAFGVAYKISNKNLVLKRQKLNPDHILYSPDDDFWREIRFMNWVNTLTDSNESRHFAKMSSYKISQSDWVHLPKQLTDTRASEEMKARIRKANTWPWIGEHVSEYKGRPLNIEDVTDPKKRYGLIIQLLTIVHILRKHSIANTDMHPGNFVIDERDTLVMLDYADTFFPGDNEYDNEIPRDITMLFETTGMLVGHFSYKQMEKEGPEYREPELEYVVDFGLERFPELYMEVKRLCALYNVDVINKKTDKHTEFAFAVMLDLIQLLHPKEYQEMMKFSDPVPVLVTPDDVYAIYNGWNDLPNVIGYFTKKRDRF
jgi:hypothetical protein